MILADTSVWVDHLRKPDHQLSKLLDAGMVLGHPLVAAELALGNLRRESPVLRLLARIPGAVVATHDEVMTIIDTHDLAGRGVGVVDAHLLAATLLTPAAKLWTQDRRLEAAAKALAVAA